MFDASLIQKLAAELHQSEKARVQVEHFSKRYPGMTIEDGYAVSRAWVEIKLAEGRVDQGPQDRPDLARHAAVQPDHRARLRHAARRHVLPRGQRHPVHALHRAARRGRTRLRPRQAAARPERDDLRRAGRDRLRGAGDRDHRRAHRAVRPPHQGHAQGLRHHLRQRRQRRHHHRRATRQARRGGPALGQRAALQERRDRGDRAWPPPC